MWLDPLSRAWINAILLEQHKWSFQSTPLGKRNLSPNFPNAVDWEEELIQGITIISPEDPELYVYLTTVLNRRAEEDMAYWINICQKNTPSP